MRPTTQDLLDLQSDCLSAMREAWPGTPDGTLVVSSWVIASEIAGGSVDFDRAICDFYPPTWLDSQTRGLSGEVPASVHKCFGQF